MRLAIPVGYAGFRIISHARASHLVNTEARHRVRSGKTDALCARGFEHGSGLFAAVIEQFVFVVAVLHVRFEDRNAPGIHALAIDFDVILFASQALGPDCHTHVPLALAERVFVRGAETGSAPVERRRAAALVTIAANEPVGHFLFDVSETRDINSVGAAWRAGPGARLELRH